MAEIEIGTLTDDTDRYQTAFSTQPTVQPSVKLSDRDDRQTIHKVQSLTIPPLPLSSSPSLAGRVESSSMVEAAKEEILSMDPEELRAIDAKLEELQENPPETSYWIKVCEIVGKILAQFNRISEKERVQMDDLKTKYRKSNHEWGQFQKEMGDRSMNFTWGALVVMASAFAFPQADREIINYLGNQGCNNLANMMNSGSQSKQKLADSVGQLALSEINAKINKGSNDASSKQEVIALLDKVLQSLKESARAG